MKVYAIRHTPTGKYLPAAQRKLGLDSSRVLPDSDRPLLFWQTKHASAALSTWLKGTREGTRRNPTYAPQPNRKRSDMEIVEFDLAHVAGRKPTRKPREEKLLGTMERFLREFEQVSAVGAAVFLGCDPAYATKTLKTLVEQGIARRERNSLGAFIYSYTGESHEQRQREGQPVTVGGNARRCSPSVRPAEAAPASG